MGAGAYALGTVLLGGTAGGLSAAEEAKSKRRRADKYIDEQWKIQQLINDTAGDRIAETNKVYDPFLAGFGENAADYYDTLKNADYGQFDVTAPGEFEFDMDAATQAELNPDLAAIIDRASGAVESSAASRGALRSGATQKQVARSTADIQAAEWDKARTRAQQTYQNKYQQFVDSFRNKLAANQFNREGYGMNLGAKKDLYGAQSDMFGNQRDELNEITGAQDQGIIQSRGEIAKAESDKAGVSKNYWSNFLQGFGSGAAGSTTGAANVYSAFK